MPGLQYVPIGALACRKQVRDHPGELELLAGTLKAVGMRHPIHARRVNGVLEIITGERRWRAAGLAGLLEVPAVIEDREMSDAEIAELQLIENCAREDLRPLEEARAISRLLELSGIAAGDAARRIGRSPSTVSKLLSLLTLSPEQQRHVESGAISLSGGYELAQIANPTVRAKLAEEMVAGKLTRDQLVKRKARLAKGSVPAKPRSMARARTQRIAVPVETGCTVTVSGAALTLERVIAWLDALAAKLRAVAPGVALEAAVRSLRSDAKERKSC